MAREALRTVACALLLSFFLSTVFAQFQGNSSCPKRPARCPRTWDYSSPQNWGSACVGWQQCSGSSQSPIDITTPVNRYGCMDAKPSFKYNYPLISTWLFNTGNFFGGAFVSQGQTPQTFTYQGQKYVLQRFVFHSPSEHLIGGRRFDLELQLFHYAAGNGKPLAVSVFFQRSAGASTTNQFLEQLVYDLPQFSDCRCGNGRMEVHTPLEPVTPTVGVTEQCDNGERNSDASLPSGQPNCCRSNCKLARCGDGIVDYGEACDLGAGNKNVSGVCRTTCCLPTCGDGIVDPGEQCDDGNRHNLDGCSSICLWECGDNETNFRFGLEQCDNGTNNSLLPDSCRPNCRLPTCGDNVTDSLEECDDAANHGINPSQCRDGCKAHYCGDAMTDEDEWCDDGIFNGPNHTCSSTCSSQCGDGIIQTGEECDDGGANSESPDASCRTNCKRSRCGDGIIDILAGEQCDSVYSQDPTNVNFNVGNWWCSSNCTQMCGSGLKPVNTTKECDHGCYNADAPNRCRTTCLRPACGDGIMDSGELCDNGVKNSNSLPNACRVSCTLPKCGDGVVDAGEQCDDKNNLPLDGCDPSCKLECGNGNLEAGEECDLGTANANVANTCRTNCKLPVCGDGILDSLEECDTGVNNSNSRPNACRTDCRVPFCGDGIIDTANGEKCDNGVNNNDFSVNGCSRFCIPNYCRQRQVRVPVTLALALPSNLTSFSYTGSQTMPPCAEGVQWLVFSEVQTMSDRQYAAFTDSKYGISNKARPVQSLNNRTVSRPCVLPAPVCGNGIQEAGEQCDLGMLLNSDWEANRCRSNCKKPSCGDSITDKGEECDDGAANWRCTSTCTLKAVLRNPFQPIVPWARPGAPSAFGAHPAARSHSCKWAFASPLFALCAGDRSNAAQSPVNIVTSRVQGFNPLPGGLPTYAQNAESSISFVNTGLNLHLIASGNNALGGANLVRIEFHSPSEHTINGNHADLEAQLLHANADGSFVGVSLLYNIGASKSKFLAQFDFYVPKFAECGANNGIIEPGEECDDGPMNSDSRPGACRRNGKKPSCGDGVVDRGEQCDDGMANGNAANKCKTNCLLPQCGDGYVDRGEQCDPAATPATCNSRCQLLCGNGVVEAGEECDDGARNSDVLMGACRTNCKKAYCGDNVVDAGEWCDDGVNSLVSDVCRPGCVLPTCGDGVTDFGEDCDNGLLNNDVTGVCDTNCRFTCGNGLMPVGTNKQCDNGARNSNSDGACRTNCQLPTCGDNILDAKMGEQCDLGLQNGVKSGGLVLCTATCMVPCGDGVVDTSAGEQCDDGTLNDDTLPGACRSNCRRAYCGDGVKDVNEQCDFGTQNADNSGAPCRSDCKLPRCGDKILDKDVEQCDDGNNNNGDGCSATCMFECGNGRRDGSEECDEGMLNSDKLPNACRPQGFVVGGKDLSCKFPICGDGVVDEGEQCDDGASNGQGPNKCRLGCLLPTCGDGVVDDLYGEVCDAGIGNSDTSVTGCSTTCRDNRCRSCTAGARTFNPSVFFAEFANSPAVKYTGSLTSPPCAERVTWYVFTQPATISPKQLAIFKGAVGDNARDINPLNGRQITWANAAGPVCGNCVVEADEQCDTGDNNANAADKCRTTCRKPACGDGILDSGEECDAGAQNAAAGPCNLQCKWVRTCPAICTAGQCGTCAVPAPNPVAPTCASSLNNSGTLININFARLLAGAGCTGPNCSQ